MDWLIGSWQGTYNARPFYEAWHKLNDSTLLNFTIEIKNGDTLIQENGIIRVGRNESYYRSRDGQWSVLEANDTGMLLSNDTLKVANRILWSHTKNDHWFTEIKNQQNTVTYDLTRVKWLNQRVGDYISHIEAQKASPVQTMTRDVTVKTNDGIQLIGTLTKPAAVGRTPLIILIHGSGNDTRQNPYYKQLANRFNENGYSVFTYDKRGSGESTGSWIDVPFSYLKDDVLSVVNKLKEDTSFTKIGVWGGSEGSCVALWAASESDKISFVIAQSFTSLPFSEQNTYQTHVAIKALSNNNTDDINARMRVQELVHHYALTGEGYDKYAAAVNALRHKTWFLKTLGEPMSADNKWWGWYKTKMNIAPVRFLQGVHVPVLFIWGEVDELVPVSASVDLVKAKAKGKNVVYKVFKNANHSLSGNNGEAVHVQFMQEWLKKICKDYHL
jgi:pimeloyl-ACP methyl ester carboxylesterase